MALRRRLSTVLPVALRLSAAILVLTPALASAQVTLFGDEFESGGYGGPVAMAGSFNGSLVAFAGGQGGWVVNRTFGIGGISINEVGVTGTSAADDQFYVVQPSFGLEINVTPWFRFAAVGTYRLVAGVSSQVADGYGLSGADLSGPAVALQFRFGKY